MYEQPQLLQEWYLGLCIESINDVGDTCSIIYPYKNFILKFNVLHDSLREWEFILEHVNKSLENWDCTKP